MFIITLLNLLVVRFQGLPLLEPSCGDGAIVQVLQEKNLNVTGKDLSLGQDFLEETERYDAIITNPPFSLAYEFIKKAKTLTDYFAFLLPLSYLHGKKRFDDIYSDGSFSLSRVYVFTRYPMLGEKLRKDGSKAYQSRIPPRIGPAITLAARVRAEFLRN